MKDCYFSIKSPTEAIFKDKGSKFIAYSFPVSTEDEVKYNLDFLRKKYFDATHHCYAYMLGADGKQFRANDDGEPAHSAGTPILNQIKSAGLSDVLIVVVRYYGGTKLGVSGLISAYKTSAALALQEAIKVEVIIKKEFRLEFDFELMNSVMRLVKEFNASVLSQDFQEKNILNISIREGDVNRFLEKLNDLRGLDVTPVS